MGRNLVFLIVPATFCLIGLVIANPALIGSGADGMAVARATEVVWQDEPVYPEYPATPEAGDGDFFCGDSWRFVLDARPVPGHDTDVALADLERVLEDRLAAARDFAWFLSVRSLERDGNQLSIVIDHIAGDEQRDWVEDVLTEEAALEFVDLLEQPVLPGTVVPTIEDGLSTPDAGIDGGTPGPRELFPVLADNRDLVDVFPTSTEGGDLALGLELGEPARRRIDARFAELSNGHVAVLMDRLVLDVQEVEAPVPADFVVAGVLAGNKAGIEARVAQLQGGRLPLEVTGSLEEEAPRGRCS